MLPRLAILIAFFSFLEHASAQFYSPGMVMGQSCPYPFQAAPQILPPGLQQRELEREARREAREMAAEIGAQIAEKLREIAIAKRPLFRRLRPGPATVVFRHLEDRGDGYGLVECNGAPPRRARPLDPAPVYDPRCAGAAAPTPPAATVDQVLKPRVLPGSGGGPTEGSQTAPEGSAAPAAPPSSEAPAAPAPGGTSDNRQVDCSRMPAQQRGDSSLSGDPDDDEVSPGASDAPAPRETARSRVPARASQAFCVDNADLWIDRYADSGGRLRGEICSDHYPAIQADGGSDAECAASLDNLYTLYDELAVLRAERARELGAARIEGRFGRRHGGFRGGGLQGQFGNFMNMLRGMRGGNVMRSYPYAPGTPYSGWNYGAGGYGYPNVYNGYYGGGPGGIPNGGFCNNGQNPMWQNPYLNSMMPPWANGMGPWGMPQGPQIRPLPGQGWPGQGWPNGLGQGGPQIRPIPFMRPGMPGMPGVPLGGGVGGQFGAPGRLPLAGGVNGGLPFAPGLNGMPVGVPSFAGGGYVPGALPLGGTLGGQLGYMGNSLGAWGAGAIPNSFYGGTSYVGPGYSYQPGYFNMPPVGGAGGGAPYRLPMGPY